MKLLKGVIRPGTVREVLQYGIIKASAPGLFSYEDDMENLPPIMPWQIGSNCNSFSQPKIYDEVWIINFADNPRQLYWFRKDSVENNENLLEENDNNIVPLTEENVEVVCNRNVAGEWATIYFSDGSGWVISKGEQILNLASDGSIKISTGMPNRSIIINNEGILIGGETNTHPIAKADKVEDVLYAICSLIGKIGKDALLNPYTTAIGTSIMSNLPKITEKIPNISSAHVFVD